MDARTVQCHASAPGDAIHAGPLRLRWVEPAEWGDDIFARLQDGSDHVGVSHERAVQDAVSLEGQESGHITGGGDPEELTAQKGAEVDTLLGRAMDPCTHQLKIGVLEYAGHGGTPYPSCGPLNDSKPHRSSFAGWNRARSPE